MIKHLSVKVLPLTKELAAAVADMPGVTGERPLIPQRTAFLNERLKEGNFHPPRWARTLVLSTGQTIRVNGHHSSSLLRDLPELPSGMKVVLDEFECADEQEAAVLFMQFDPPESARGLGDITRAHARIHSELAQITDRTIARAMRGVILASKLSTGLQKISLHQKAQLVHNAAPFIQWVGPLLSVQILDRAPAMAAMERTFDADPEGAKIFWPLVIEESDPDKDHPTRLIKRMLDELVVAAAGRQNAKTKKRNRLDDRAIVVRCLVAWNAWCTAKQISQLRYDPKADFPTVLNRAAAPVPAENAPLVGVG